MVSDSHELSQADSMPIRPTHEECLASLSTRSWVQSIGEVIKVQKDKNGSSSRYWIHFAGGIVCFVQSLAILRSPTKMEDLLSDAAGRSVVIADKKVWKLCDADWLMCLATERQFSPMSFRSILQEILSEPDYVHSNGPLSRREVASIFAEEAKALKYANDGTPHVAVEGCDGTYLYGPSLRIIWQRRYGELPHSEDLTATLYQSGFKPLTPTPCGAGQNGKVASLHMWRKRNAAQD